MAQSHAIAHKFKCACVKQNNVDMFEKCILFFVSCERQNHEAKLINIQTLYARLHDTNCVFILWPEKPNMYREAHTKIPPTEKEKNNQTKTNQKKKKNTKNQKQKKKKPKKKQKKNTYHKKQKTKTKTKQN